MWPTLITTPLSLSLSPFVGATEAQSLTNFKQWIDQFVLMCCHRACLVYDQDNNRLHGLYHHMLKGEHENFEGALSNLVLWALQCQNAGIFAGKYVSVAPTGRGETQFTHKKLGPFQ